MFFSLYQLLTVQLVMLFLCLFAFLNTSTNEPILHKAYRSVFVFSPILVNDQDVFTLLTLDNYNVTSEN